jgi:hypothetical protein
VQDEAKLLGQHRLSRQEKRLSWAHDSLPWAKPLLRQGEAARKVEILEGIRVGRSCVVRELVVIRTAGVDTTRGTIKAGYPLCSGAYPMKTQGIEQGIYTEMIVDGRSRKEGLVRSPEV